MSSLVDQLGGVSEPVLLLVAAAMVVAETALVIGVVLPGLSVVLTLGFLSYLRLVDLPLALLTAAICAVTGGHLAYLAGRRRGGAALDSQAGWRVRRIVGRVIRVDPWVRAHALLDLHGEAAVALSQWVVGVRTLTPRLVGAADVPYRRFAMGNIPSAVAWGCTWVLAGYLTGQAYQQVARVLGVVSLGLLGVGVLVAVVRLRLVDAGAR